jgi:hypothetical protein
MQLHWVGYAKTKTEKRSLCLDLESGQELGDDWQGDYEQIS